jgi:hypothetical protein
MIVNFLRLTALTLSLASIAFAARPQVSNDPDLKEIDLNQWDCRNRPEGTAKTPDGAERNRLKNRSAPEGPLPAAELTDSAGFLKRISQFEALTKGRRRKELTPDQKQKLDPLEKQIVTMTGYLSLAYCGPPESTNCGSGDFHDWHLEVFEKPLEHPPQPGDPTPIICEITPRTQNAIYRAGIRLQELTAFFRRADLSYEPTGHKAQKVRVTGYLLWDDEHNGAADVGTAIRTVGANKFHNPWRSVAWEIHPVIKIERADGVAALSPTEVAPTPGSSAPAPTVSVSSPAAPAITVPPVAATATPPQFLTVVQPVRIRIPYGETTVPKGMQLKIVSRNAGMVTVEYMGGIYPIPISSTDLR